MHDTLKSEILQIRTARNQKGLHKTGLYGRYITLAPSSSLSTCSSQSEVRKTQEKSHLYYGRDLFA